MATYVPDEHGELTAVLTAAESTSQMMPPVDLGTSAIKMFLTLLALIGLLFVSYWFIRRLVQQRLQKGVGNAAIHILEKRMVSPKTMLYLIEVEGKRTLFAESQLEIKRLEGFEEKPYTIYRK